MGLRDRIVNAVSATREPAQAGSAAMAAGQTALNHGATHTQAGVAAAAAFGAAAVRSSADSHYNGDGPDHADFHEPRDVTNTPSGVEVRWQR